MAVFAPLGSYYIILQLFVLEMMRCGICEEIKRRKAAGFPKKMIKSVANWWWVNVHDSECTSGNTLSDWVQDMETVTMDNQYDEGQVLDN